MFLWQAGFIGKANTRFRTSAPKHSVDRNILSSLETVVGEKGCRLRCERVVCNGTTPDVDHSGSQGGGAELDGGEVWQAGFIGKGNTRL